MRKWIAGLILIFLLASFKTKPSYSLDSIFGDNFVVPESQTGFLAEAYEIKAGRKFQRGAENFFLSWLEIPHGVKTEIVYRKQEYLHVGVETFFLGLFKGLFKSFGRAGVGLYEMFTFPYPQDPIIEEMGEWLY